MRLAGIDIGSRTIKVVVVEGGRPVQSRVLPTTHDPIEVCRAALDGLAYDRMVATGYGRHLFRRYWECEVITEIKAVAVGAKYLLPSARTILDVGGQDTKAIALDGDGTVTKFEMNDRCAAGTGRFLEVTAAALAYSMADFVRGAFAASEARKISSMCTVFAESELISLVARGAPRDELALGIHEGIVGRSVGLLHRVPVEDELLFCGGVAWNDCFHGLLQKRLGRPVHVPEEPQIVAALGCALCGGNGQD